MLLKARGLWFSFLGFLSGSWIRLMLPSWNELGIAHPLPLSGRVSIELILLFKKNIWWNMVKTSAPEVFFEGGHWTVNSVSLIDIGLFI